MPTILLSAPYMLPIVPRFQPLFDHYGMKLLLPEVHERMSEDEIMAYAGQFDGTLCGDDRYTRRVIAACAPRLNRSQSLELAFFLAERLTDERLKLGFTPVQDFDMQ